MKAAMCLVLTSLTLLGACQRQAEPAAGEGAAASGQLQVWPLLAEQGAAQPDLAIAADGRVLLSWISVRRGRDNALMFAAYDNQGRWQSTPKTIAVGEALLSNWADTPHIAATPDGALWVHWLQKTSASPGEYDLALSHSGNRGFNWSAPIVVNSDRGGGEHGFASLWPASQATLGIAWLNPADASDDASHESHGGMSLRAASFDGALQRIGEHALDGMTCECCQTDVAMAARGPVVVFRDRDADDIRDIAAVRYDGKTWSAPVRVHADGWKMTACPVNGPAAAAKGDDVLVAWYTAAGGEPALQLALSRDGGASFGAPVRVDRGAAMLGRVDAAYDSDGAWVLWLREDAGAQSLWLARYSADLKHQVSKTKIAGLQGRGAATGFPKLALRQDGAYMVWTESVDGQPRLRGARMLR